MVVLVMCTAGHMFRYRCCAANYTRFSCISHQTVMLFRKRKVRSHKEKIKWELNAMLALIMLQSCLYLVDMALVLILILLFLARVSHRPLTLQHIGQIHLPVKVMHAYTYSTNVSVLLIPFASSYKRFWFDKRTQNPSSTKAFMVKCL
jgi:hypothetical protein